MSKMSLALPNVLKMQKTPSIKTASDLRGMLWRNGAILPMRVRRRESYHNQWFALCQLVWGSSSQRPPATPRPGLSAERDTLPTSGPELDQSQARLPYPCAFINKL